MCAGERGWALQHGGGISSSMVETPAAFRRLQELGRHINYAGSEYFSAAAVL